MAQWAPWLAPAVRWVAWAHPAPWVDRVALKWLVLLVRWELDRAGCKQVPVLRQQALLLGRLDHPVNAFHNKSKKPF